MGVLTTSRVAYGSAGNHGKENCDSRLLEDEVWQRQRRDVGSHDCDDG